jgi:hypothetical protein
VLVGADRGGGELAHQPQSQATGGGACLRDEADALVNHGERELVAVNTSGQRQLTGRAGIGVAHGVAAGFGDRQCDSLRRLIGVVAVVAGKGGYCGS